MGTPKSACVGLGLAQKHPVNTVPIDERKGATPETSRAANGELKCRKTSVVSTTKVTSLHRKTHFRCYGNSSHYEPQED